jgi:hypothetical protein
MRARQSKIAIKDFAVTNPHHQQALVARKG